MLSNYPKKLIARIQYPSLWILIGISSLILFLCSSLKHAVYKSTAFDLGIFDQALYLISQGQIPFSSLTDYHILADHAAFILYPLSLLYWIHANVHWLFIVQAISLSIACYPAFRLALLAGLTQSQGMVVSAVCLLYPVVFNINLFDFHTEVIAIPSILWMVFAARSRQTGLFFIALLITLSCKDALSLTVVAIGLWMILIEDRKKYGFLALISGVTWFFIASKLVIPWFHPEEAAGVSRYLDKYNELGKTPTEIIRNFFVHPQLVLSQIFSIENLQYLGILCLPVIYIFLARSITPFLQLVPAIPTLLMNILANPGEGALRDLIHQYSLPILPFIALTVIACFQEKSFSFLSGRRGRIAIVSWAAMCFIMFSQLSYFFGPYYGSASTFRATRNAVARVEDGKSVLTTAEVVPHLTHRPLIEMIVVPNGTHRRFIEITGTDDSPDIKLFDTILLNTRHPGLFNTEAFSLSLVDELTRRDEYRLSYEQDGVYLFVHDPKQ
jgi:uncharacterized membrane protein